MRLYKNIFIFFIIFFITESQAAKVDTINIFSPSMQKEIKVIVVTPENYNINKKHPVIYLLHGFGGNYATWIKINEKDIKETADKKNIIIATPDGGKGSWYFDSPVDNQWKYETFVSKELIETIDKQYSTIQSSKGRGITGLSMGGHGALYLAFKHQNIFGAAGSMSGGVDIRPFPKNWDISKRLGTYAENPENWEKNTVINMLHLLTANSLKLIIDCGTDDFFYQVNCNLHEKLLERNIPHDFISRPGRHNAEYWKNAVKYQLVFMTDFFEN